MSDTYTFTCTRHDSRQPTPCLSSAAGLPRGDPPVARLREAREGETRPGNLDPHTSLHRRARSARSQRHSTTTSSISNLPHGNGATHAHARVAPSQQASHHAPLSARRRTPAAARHGRGAQGRHSLSSCCASRVFTAVCRAMQPPRAVTLPCACRGLDRRSIHMSRPDKTTPRRLCQRARVADASTSA